MKNQKSPPKLCLQCGDEVRGRADKKFCCDDCRTAYNNDLNRDANKFMGRINRILRANRRILARMNPTGKTTVTREKLLTSGFNFSYYTNIYRTKGGRSYYFVYDHGYIKLDDGRYTLVFRKEYVD